MDAYVVRDEANGRYYAVLPDRGFVAWVSDLIHAKFFPTEAEARASFTDRTTGRPWRHCESQTVVPVTITETEVDRG